MAFRTKKISQMDPKGANLASTDLLEISQLVSGSYVTKSITGAEIVAGATTGFVPTSRTLTINGVTQDLSANRTFTISTGITIGTTAITSGTVGRVLFEGTGNVVQESANLFFDATNNRLGINTSTPTNPLSVYRSGSTNFFNFEPSATGTAPFISAFFAGGFELRLNLSINTPIGAYTIAQGATFFNQSITSNAGLLAGSIGATNGLIAVSGNNANVHIASNTSSILSFRENGVADRGILGYQNGTSYMQIRVNGATSYATGTMSTAFFSTGNVGINTTTDAGFKLDVNGTARVSGELTVNGVSIGLGGGANTLNTILGATALSSNTTGTGNTAIGNQAIKDNISGINNTAVGLNALRFTKGSGNTGIGAAAGFNLISNSDNTFVGYNSGLNTTGSRNTLIGNGAGDSLTTGVENTAIGYRAGRGTTSTASYNTSLGVQANISITSGQFNLSAGNNALYFNTTGSNNTALGSYSGQYITGGVTNNTISNNSIYIGNNTKAFADNQTNQIVIGYDATGAGSNTATLGNTSIVDTILRGRVNLQQYATGSRPTYVKGALIYDSTLSKLVVGGASGWEVVTSI
jgi:hypothetical protein